MRHVFSTQRRRERRVSQRILKPFILCLNFATPQSFLGKFNFLLLFSAPLRLLKQSSFPRFAETIEIQIATTIVIFTHRMIDHSRRLFYDWAVKIKEVRDDRQNKADKNEHSANGRIGSGNPDC